MLICRAINFKCIDSFYFYDTELGLWQLWIGRALWIGLGLGLGLGLGIYIFVYIESTCIAHIFLWIPGGVLLLDTVYSGSHSPRSRSRSLSVFCGHKSMYLHSVWLLSSLCIRKLCSCTFCHLLFVVRCSLSFVLAVTATAGVPVDSNILFNNYALFIWPRVMRCMV